MKFFSRIELDRRGFVRLAKAMALGVLLRRDSVIGKEGVNRLYFNVPEGRAIKTLRLAVKQAKVEMMMPAEVLKGVRTRKIVGVFTPGEAFAKMLSDTPLVAVKREGSGVYTIKIAEKPKGSSVLETKMVH